MQIHSTLSDYLIGGRRSRRRGRQRNNALESSLQLLDSKQATEEFHLPGKESQNLIQTPNRNPWGVYHTKLSYLHWSFNSKNL